MNFTGWQQPRCSSSTHPRTGAQIAALLIRPTVARSGVLEQLGERRRRVAMRGLTTGMASTEGFSARRDNSPASASRPADSTKSGSPARLGSWPRNSLPERPNVPEAGPKLPSARPGRTASQGPPRRPLSRRAATPTTRFRFASRVATPVTAVNVHSHQSTTPHSADVASSGVQPADRDQMLYAFDRPSVDRSATSLSRVNRFCP